MAACPIGFLPLSSLNSQLVCGRYDRRQIDEAHDRILHAPRMIQSGESFVCEIIDTLHEVPNGRQVLERASPLGFSIPLIVQKRQRTAALQDALARTKANRARDKAAQQ